MGILWEEGSVSLQEGMLHFFRLRYTLILACAYEIQLYSRPEKYVSICSDSQADLKAFQATRTSPLVQQCQNRSTDISIWHTVGLYWIPGQAGVRGNEIANMLIRDGSVQSLLDLSHLWGSPGRI